ncbi:O-acetyl-ADP-ribose deacetylase (regulator of RNase III)/uncharacterized protein YwgA [Catalinimonas alkaloidigena]|uniref:type II toxin-antitoxin system antitoxin DNA ADP-ribosyl glycohydrolase DarG n=1 Tax=Catalinimonas alkaloidigena TaxID=1075417 RepID=UPI0024053879|nr:macro domain-containing protein [Catalinimonas alkaloidigena]MDF9794993.1 O-acetyl-ADP-ribose deacetylase (regulator of RNase III)/uncharacterized protein YwgA [Catalinimonas alkaloidigena]
MIQYTQGNLLDAPTEALVNTVNTMGIMGKGIALQFKEAFPENFRAYKKACEQKELVPGKLLWVKELTPQGEKWIVNFPTKTVYYRKSSYKYVEEGLKTLASDLKANNIKSIAIPPLGCGNGGLKWDKVKAVIEQYLAPLGTEVLVYEPNPNIKAQLRKESPAKEVKLTPARAMLLFTMFQYERLGEETSLFVANKLVYFLQRMGEQQLNKLDFTPSYYGPYSPAVGHVLYHLNGKYIQGMEQKNAKPFEPLLLNYELFEEVNQYVHTKLSNEQYNRLQDLLKLIDGFESAFSLELLASVDFLLKDNPQASAEELLPQIAEWSDRKTKMFKKEYVEIAYQHLKQYQSEKAFMV